MSIADHGRVQTKVEEVHSLDVTTCLIAHTIRTYPYPVDYRTYPVRAVPHSIPSRASSVRYEYTVATSQLAVTLAIVKHTSRETRVEYDVNGTTEPVTS